MQIDATYCYFRNQLLIVHHLVISFWRTLGNKQWPVNQTFLVRGHPEELAHIYA